jgi:hypothetical protein
MALRRHLVLVLAGVFASCGASFRTQNFVVEAPTPEIAQKVGVYAERYRQEKALEWLGREMPPWPQPCPLTVKVTMSGAGGATSFAFDNGQVLGQRMNIEGSLERLLNSVLPHEVTHTVFAHYFRCPVPRWADEGGAVLSEDDVERGRHDQMARQVLRQGRAFTLRRLFSLREYPSDVMCLYAEGFSVVNFLVASSNRPQFLQFVAHGMQYGWDQAAQTYYRYRNLEEMEQAWLNYLKSPGHQAPTILASNPQPVGGEPARTIVRLTAPPAQPLQDMPAPVFRGQSPPEQEERPPAAPPRRADSWQPPQQQPTAPPNVRLGPPQSASPFAPPPQPTPRSPVGYPY